MKNHLILVVLFCFCVFVDSAFAVNQTSSTQWDRSSAMAAVRSVNIDTAGL